MKSWSNPNTIILSIVAWDLQALFILVTQSSEQEPFPVRSWVSFNRCGHMTINSIWKKSVNALLKVMGSLGFSSFLP